MHPRPSPIAAAMYTLRDLDVDVIVLHGPSGCCFRPARLLERDGIKVVTSAMNEEDFIFGAESKLVEVLRKVDELFSPRLIGVVGSCASMIIGEDLKRAAFKAGVGDRSICCAVHSGSGSGDNTKGAIIVLNEAAAMGLITDEELVRQKKMLTLATELEHRRGTARCEYIPNLPGDTPQVVAEELVRLAKNGARIDCVLNAKKETAFLYADILIAVSVLEQKTGVHIRKLANLDTSVGLPRIRSYASTILGQLGSLGIKIDHITGGLDEYPIAGSKAKEILMEEPPDIAIVAGIPHAVEIEKAVKSIAITVGTRAVSNLKSLGYGYVIAERDAHALSLGPNKSIKSSLFGRVLRRAVEAL